MTDELEQTLVESSSNNPPTPTVTIPPQLKSSKKKIWIIVGIALGLLCLCAIIFVAVFAMGVKKVSGETAPITSVLDSFMRQMVAKDAEGAYALYSPRAQRQIPISKLRELFNDRDYILYEGYQSLSIQKLSISSVVNSDPDNPQGIVAKVSGTITYDGGIQGTFDGTLEKVDGNWQLHGMMVTVPTSKIK